MTPPKIPCQKIYYDFLGVSTPKEKRGYLINKKSKALCLLEEEGADGQVGGGPGGQGG